MARDSGCADLVSGLVYAIPGISEAQRDDDHFRLACVGMYVVSLAKSDRNRCTRDVVMENRL